jgi:hypothetical protein
MNVPLFVSFDDEVSLVQQGVSVSRNTCYEVTICASTSATRNIKFGIQEIGGAWQIYAVTEILSYPIILICEYINTLSGNVVDNNAQFSLI